MSAQLAEAVTAAPDLVAYDAADYVHSRLGDTDRRLVDAQLKAAWLNGLGSGLVLLGVGLAVGAGEVIALGGPSGSGKSTLAMTLLGLIEPRSGVITLGGVDLKHCSGSDIRQRIGLLQQDGHIFSTSIREDLRIALPDATDDALWRRSNARAYATS